MNFSNGWPTAENIFSMTVFALTSWAILKPSVLRIRFFTAICPNLFFMNYGFQTAHNKLHILTSSCLHVVLNKSREAPRTGRGFHIWLGLLHEMKDTQAPQEHKCFRRLVLQLSRASLILQGLYVLTFGCNDDRCNTLVQFVAFFASLIILRRGDGNWLSLHPNELKRPG